MKFILLLSFFISQAFAGNAVLLTSLELPQKKLAKLEKQFLKSFGKSDLTPVIHHKVGPKLLLETMTSSENEVIIWVSHAAGEKQLQNGMSAENIVVDIHGNDVKRFFTSPHKGMRFLGLVGCEAQTIIDGYKAKGFYQDIPELEIMSFKKKVELFGGFKKVLERSQEVLQRSVDEDKESAASETMQLNISRSEGEARGWIELGDKVVSYVEDSSSMTADFDYSFWSSLDNKNIKFIRDLEFSKDLPMGLLSLTLDTTSWKLFAAHDGRALGGKNQQLYIYKK